MSTSEILVSVMSLSGRNRYYATRSWYRKSLRTGALTMLCLQDQFPRDFMQIIGETLRKNEPKLVGTLSKEERRYRIKFARLQRKWEQRGDDDTIYHPGDIRNWSRD